jgi:hypothetical protein
MEWFNVVRLHGKAILRVFSGSMVSRVSKKIIQPHDNDFYHSLSRIYARFSSMSMTLKELHGFVVEWVEGVFGWRLTVAK